MTQAIRFIRCRLLLIVVMGSTLLVGGCEHRVTQVQPAQAALTNSRLASCGEASDHKVPATIHIFERFGNREWLNEDVGDLISDPERAAFKTLQNDEDRDNFMQWFWRRRDPTPDTIENEFQDEHYRRIVAANQRFSSSIPGWRTDRGRLYVLLGAPDSVTESLEQFPAETPPHSGTSHPVEIWTYRYAEGLGVNVTLRFVDVCNCGDFRLHTPGGIDSLLDLKRCRDGLTSCPNTQEKKTPDLSYTPAIGLERPPQVRFKDLEAVVVHKIHYNTFPLSFNVVQIRATQPTDWIALTIQVHNKDLAWKQSDGKHIANLYLFARFLTLTGRVAAIVEDDLKQEVPDSEWPLQESRLWQFSRSFPLRGAHYRVDLAVQDVNADRYVTSAKGIVLPEHYSVDLGSSSLVLADQIEQPVLRTQPPDRGDLFIDTTKIHQRLADAQGGDPVFSPSENLQMFMQAYGLRVDPRTHESSALIDYAIMDQNGNKRFHIQEQTRDIKQLGEQITLQKTIPLQAMEPGTYRLCVTVADEIAHAATMQSASFAIR